MLQSVLNLEPEVLFRLQSFVFVLLALLLLERWLPQRQPKYSGRALANTGLQLINLLLILIVPVSLTAAALLALFNQFGLFNLVKLGLWSKIVISWILMDLLMYVLHRAYHGLGFLWRFHKVHHGDQALDLTTTFRTHPVETLITLAVRAGAVALIGMPLLGVVIYEVVVCAMALFIHANIRLNNHIDRLLGWILITPSMHRIHHGSDPADYGSNFGLVISVWDRIFGTLRVRPSAEPESAIGIPGLNSEAGVMPMLTQPFKSST
ncbi:MAG: sterol desaturase family protein [Gammaproteobacteria bacterium]|jgi:sterol desaturase/sphingolipid hydroxylase (fatty acid hydroxylase superfamily)